MGIKTHEKRMELEKNMGHKSLPCGFDTVAIEIRSEGMRERKRINGDMGFDAGNR